MSFDISIAFDTVEYVNPQLYMLVDTLKDKLPEDTILHIITNRDENDDVVSHIISNVNSKYHYNDGSKTKDLKSRCKYMFNCFDINTDKDYLLTLDCDILVLKHLKELEDVLKLGYDVVLQPENRKIFNDAMENRLWRHIYKSMNINIPNFKIHYIENHEEGLPLFNTGVVAVKKEKLKIINEEWHNLIKICEKWIKFGIHPNEFAFTALVLKNKMNWGWIGDVFNFNPIGYWRDGEFPSVKLVEECNIPESVVLLHYHRPQWLMHLANKNKYISDVLCSNDKYIPDEWWNLTNKEFIENEI